MFTSTYLKSHKTVSNYNQLRVKQASIDESRVLPTIYHKGKYYHKKKHQVEIYSGSYATFTKHGHCKSH